MRPPLAFSTSAAQPPIISRVSTWFGPAQLDMLSVVCASAGDASHPETMISEAQPAFLKHAVITASLSSDDIEVHPATSLKRPS